jgi:hypothetical protein
MFFEEIAYRDYFLPLHGEILQILKPKIHLHEGLEVPVSTIRYFHHYISQNMFWRLTHEEKIKTSVTVSDFPSEFYDETKDGLTRVYRRYEESLRELRHRSP